MENNNNSNRENNNNNNNNNTMAVDTTTITSTLIPPTTISPPSSPPLPLPLLTSLPPDQASLIIHEKLIESCGKFVFLDKLLPRLQAEGHKVLIFSQMVKVLNLLEGKIAREGTEGY